MPEDWPSLLLFLASCPDISGRPGGLPLLRFMGGVSKVSVHSLLANLKHQNEN